MKILISKKLEQNIYKEFQTSLVDHSIILTLSVMISTQFLSN